MTLIHEIGIQGNCLHTPSSEKQKGGTGTGFVLLYVCSVKDHYGR